MISLEKAIKDTEESVFLEGKVVHTERWQSVDISQKREAQMVELLHHSLEAQMPPSIQMLQNEVKPNLPWAENHFAERVCGYPLNPGTEWANWPWAKSADSHRDGWEMFNHNYMERYWPKLAGYSPTRTVKEWIGSAEKRLGAEPLEGIRNQYGDLHDLVNLLAEEPLTRQAYLPIWFPEDTGAQNTGRKPCTLGYHFIMRDNRLDLTYYIRSCDLYRHFRDDVYMTARLAQWVLQWCKAKSDKWNQVELGVLRMHITSLHMFVGDFQVMFGENPNDPR